MSEKSDIHVVPLNDLRPHDEHGRECWCCPVVQQELGQPAIVVHKSMDGRELVEQHGVN